MPCPDGDFQVTPRRHSFYGSLYGLLDVNGSLHGLFGPPLRVHLSILNLKTQKIPLLHNMPSWSNGILSGLSHVRSGYETPMELLARGNYIFLLN